MTLLTIAQDVADEVRTTVRPTSVISNTDPDAQNILRLANKVGKDLMEMFAWQVLTKEQTFTSVAGEEQTSILPSDFDRFVDETFWDRSSKRLYSGPVTSKRWQSLKASDSVGNVRAFRLRGDSVFVLPAQTAGNSLAFEYVSNQWCQSSGGAGQTVWTDDEDTGVIDEELMTLGLIFEYYKTQGLPQAAAALEDYNDKITLLSGNDNGDTPILAAGDVFAGVRHDTGEPQGTGLLS